MDNVFEEYLKQNNYEKFNLKAVLFDMDGVLYDSMKYHAKAWHQTMNEFNIPSTPEEFYLHEGQVGKSTINLIVKRNFGRDATNEEKEKIYRRKTELFSQYNKKETIPYIQDVLNKVKQYGLQPVLVTGSGQSSLIENIENDFPDTFRKDMMVTANDVKNGKPNPEPYLMGLKKAGNLMPNEAIVIENAPMGVESGIAAHIFTIAVNTGPLDSSVLWDAGANIVLPAMKDLYENWDNYMTQISSLS
ncbi:MAG: HAD family hydrolase [Dysgonomonas sp.]